MNARNEWKKVQRILGTAEDGIPGPNDEEHLTRLRLHARLDTSKWEPANAAAPANPDQNWHTGKASSFADPADVRAFKQCKRNGGSDQECFKVGDNGIGKWGDDTTAPIPMCALPPEDWQHLPSPRGKLVRVNVGPLEVLCELRDTMPRKANITNGAVVDLNPAACSAFGLTPPMLVNAKWRWA